ncbi:MAG: hypothetical protein ABSE15_12325 [Candidatus Bathyarchaeia archaeon]
MTSQKFFSPLKAGLFIVVLSYFLFALHDAFTLSWIGEWNRFFAGHFIFEVYAEDIIGFVGTIFRFAAGIVAITVLIYYFAKKGISKPATFNALRLIVVFEGIYWALAFLPTAYFETKDMFFTNMYSHLSTMAFLNSFAINDLPVLVESIVLPIILFILTYKLNPNKPLKGAIRWGMVTGTFYIFLFWLLNHLDLRCRRARKRNRLPDLHSPIPCQFRFERVRTAASRNLRLGFYGKIEEGGNSARTKSQNSWRHYPGSRHLLPLELFNMDFIRRLEQLVRMVPRTQRRPVGSSSSTTWIATAVRR